MTNQGILNKAEMVNNLINFKKIRNSPTNPLQNILLITGQDFKVYKVQLLHLREKLDVWFKQVRENLKYLQKSQEISSHTNSSFMRTDKQKLAIFSIVRAYSESILVYK